MNPVDNVSPYKTDELSKSLPKQHLSEQSCISNLCNYTFHSYL